MMRVLIVHFNIFPLRGAAIAAIFLALATTAGCQRGEPAKSKESAAEPAARSEKNADKTTAKQPTAREVLDRMIAAYRKASSYVDVGTVHLLAEADGKTIQDETANFSLAFVRPNKVRIRAYLAEVVCDGQKLYAYVKDVPDQVFTRKAPERLTMINVQPDFVVRAAMLQGFAGGMPQIPLLFGEDPLKMLMHDLGEPGLSEPGKIGEHDCYRVKFKEGGEATTFWIDQESYVLRRIVLPTDSLREAMSQAGPISNLSVVADFTGAQLNGDVDPHAFVFEAPKDAKLVEYLVPPHMGQLLNKRVPDFKFVHLDGKPLGPEAIAGKTAVLVFWSLRYDSCRQMLKELEEVYRKYKDDPKVAFYAICRDPPQLSNADLEKAIAEMNVHVPIVRDVDASGNAFNLGEPPTTFIINDKGIVQHCEGGGLNPKYAESLQARLGKVLAGQKISQEPLNQFLEQVENLRQYAKWTATDPPEPKPSDAVVVKEEPLPKTAIAPRSEPRTLKLAPAWKCADLKMPGNILVLDGSKGPERLLVIENGTSVAEVGLDGKLIALHPLELAEKEVVGSLRTAVDGDGRRYFVAFLVSQQRCHIFDEKWNLVAHFPKDALEHPHAGISDVRLGDLDGDGKLKMYVSYWGVVGVQGVSLDGHRLWSNRTAVSSVACLAISPPSSKFGTRELYCADSSRRPSDLGRRREESRHRKYGQPSLLPHCRRRPARGRETAVVRLGSDKTRRGYGDRILTDRRGIVELSAARGSAVTADRADHHRQGDARRRRPMVAARSRRFDPHPFGRRQTVGQVQLWRGAARAGGVRGRRPVRAGGRLTQRPGSVEGGVGDRWTSVHAAPSLSSRNAFLAETFPPKMPATTGINEMAFIAFCQRSSLSPFG